MIARLQKILASAGVASRRKSEELIAQGKVKVNGQVAKIGQSADSEKDLIEIGGKRIKSDSKIYIAIYKPKGYVTTVKDPFAKKMISELVKLKERVYPVGRLDADAEGLIIMTNDGDFANMVMHPRYNVEKVYQATLERPLEPGDLESINSGIEIEGRKVDAVAKPINQSKKHIEITIHEGRHKIVKRLFKEIGNYVRGLVRVRVGKVTIKGLEPGKWRYLSKEEIESFK